MLPTLLQGNKIIFPPDCGKMVAIDYIMSVIKNSDTTFITSPDLTYKDKIHILKADTGSGKSTILPASISRYYRSKDVHHTRRPSTRKRIVVTQPRILTAEQISGDLSDDDVNYPDLKRQFTLGVSTSKIKRPSSNIVFSTVGSLVESIRKMDAWENVSSAYHCIIIDEAHELTVELEILLLMLKTVYTSVRPQKLPHLIIASATLDETVFLRYFNLEKDNSFIHVSGFTYPVAVHYYNEGALGGGERAPPPPVDAAVEILARIHDGGASRPTANNDVIIFFASSREIASAEKKIHETPALRTVQTESLTRADVLKRTAQGLPIITDLRPDRRRRVFLATNAAEVGITINTLGFVVDTGTANVSMAFPYTRATSLVRCPITKHNFAQRRGRVGRKAPGVVYTTYPREVFESMSTAPTPAILLQGCAPIFLWLIRYNSLDLVTPPSFEDFQENVFLATTFEFIRNIMEEGGEQQRLVLTEEGLTVMEWGMFSSHSFNRIMLDSLASDVVCPMDVLYILVGLSHPELEGAAAKGALDKLILEEKGLDLPLPRDNGFLRILSYMYYFYHLIVTDSIHRTLRDHPLYPSVVKSCVESVSNAVTKVFKGRLYSNYENRYINRRSVEPDIVDILHSGFRFDTFTQVSKGVFKNVNGVLCEGPPVASQSSEREVVLLSHGTRMFVNSRGVRHAVPDTWCVLSAAARNRVSRVR